jgi:hypothetical protein
MDGQKPGNVNGTTTMKSKRYKLAVVTLRTIAADMRHAIENTGAASRNTLAVWHALIAQELQRLGEPNCAPTDDELNETSGEIVTKR